MTTTAQAYDHVAYTVATWVFTLHVADVAAGDEGVRDACQQVLEATEASTGNAAGEALVARVRELLGGDEPGQVAELASTLYGDRVHRDMGTGGREERLAAIRRYQFGSPLPWLARVWERREDGAVQPSWLLVERVTDHVMAADPNPWNEIDEQRTLPLADFQVLWELDGCTSVHLAAA